MTGQTVATVQEVYITVPDGRDLAGILKAENIGVDKDPQVAAAHRENKPKSIHFLDTL